MPLRRVSCTGLGPLLCGVAPDAACSVAVVDRSMPSPVVRRLYPIQGRPPGHWKRYRPHVSHVRPAIPQLRCRCTSYGGSTGASARAASADWLPAHKTLRTTTTDMLEARASCCFCSRCCMLPCAPCSPAAPCHVIVQEALLACARTSIASSSLRLLTKTLRQCTQHGRAHPAQRRNLGCDALRDREVFPTFPSRLFQASHVDMLT